MKHLWLALFTWMAVGPVGADPWVVAHRGGAKLAPENTVAAFKKAIALGADAIELDIHLSSDGELVVLHDDTLDRTFGRPGVVQRMTAAELRAAGVPMLRDVLKLSGVKWIVEIKHPHGGRHHGIEEKLLQVLEGPLDRYVVITFDQQSLRRLHELKPDLATGFLFSTPQDAEAVKRDLGVRYLGPYFRLVNPAFIKAAHDAGLKVNPWTVNEETDLRAMLDLGCDAITTDRPDRLLQLLGR
jgi:glycerophosphoryl diester phosphodiesterase